MYIKTRRQNVRFKMVSASKYPFIFTITMPFLSFKLNDWLALAIVMLSVIFTILRLDVTQLCFEAWQNHMFLLQCEALGCTHSLSSKQHANKSGSLSRFVQRLSSDKMFLWT